MSPSAGRMIVGQSYPYRLLVHCGVESAEIDGRTFYVDRPTGIRSADLSSAGQPVDVGTMTLVSYHRALFRDADGREVVFVDHLPVVTGRAYPVQVAITAPSRLDSLLFAGGVFAQMSDARPALPGAPGTTLSATATLIDTEHAVIGVGHTVIPFQRLHSVGCM